MQCNVIVAIITTSTTQRDNEMKARINYKKTNKSNGKKYMLVCGFYSNALVYVFKESYKGGLFHSRWCVVNNPKQSYSKQQSIIANGMEHQDALALFNKRAGH